MQEETKEVTSEYAFGALRGLIGAIPYAGTAINEMLFDARSRLKQNRINNFIEQLGAYIQNFSESEIDIEHIKSEEFGDFFEALLKKVATTSNKDKVNRYKELLGSQIVSPLALDFSNTFLEVIEKISENQILILKKLHDLGTTYSDHKIEVYERKQILKRYKENYQFQANSYVESSSEYEYDTKVKELENEIQKSEQLGAKFSYIFQPKTYRIEWAEFLFLLQDLASKSLIVDTSFRINDEPFSIVEITNFGIGFIDFIEHN